MGPEKGRQGSLLEGGGGSPTANGKDRVGMGRGLGEPLARTRSLQVSREHAMEDAEVPAGCSVTRSQPHTPASQAGQSHALPGHLETSPGTHKSAKLSKSMCGPLS